MVSSYIQFEDADTKSSLLSIATLNTNNDNEITYKEAANYNPVNVTINVAGESFKEFQYFTGLTKCQISGANLRILALPPNVQSKGYGTEALTYNCPNLEELIIIAPFNSACDVPFAQNTKLEKVTIVNDTDDILKSSLGNDGWFLHSTNGGYFYHNNVILRNLIVNNATIISNNIFRTDKSIKSIDCNNKITSIGIMSFLESVLEEISNTGSITSIGNNAFMSSKIKDVSFNSVTSSLLGTFAVCEDLTDIHLQSVTTLGSANSYGTFHNCINLVNCDIPNVTTIGELSFNSCYKLVSLNCSPVTIGKSAFYGCNKFVGFASTSNITSISQSAFSGCTKFVGESNLSGSSKFNAVTSIGKSAFFGCTSLTEIELKNSALTTLPGSTTGSGIDSGIFHNCTALTKVDAPNLIAIGANSFVNCSSLTTITWDWDNITTIGIQAFYNCSNIRCPSDFSANLTSIGKDAFKGCIAPTTGTYVIFRKSNGIVTFINGSGTYAYSSPFISSVTTVYVPDNLVSSYTSDTSWSQTGLQFLGISQLNV